MRVRPPAYKFGIHTCHLIDPPISPSQIHNSRVMAAAVRSTEAAPWQTTAASVPINPQASTLRRTTCDVCRERKVRCDRTKPECLRCRRSGTVCAYPSPGADAAEIQQTLQSLSKRLGESCLPLTTGPSPSPRSYWHIPEEPRLLTLLQRMLRANFSLASL